MKEGKLSLLFESLYETLVQNIYLYLQVQHQPLSQLQHQQLQHQLQRQQLLFKVIFRFDRISRPGIASK